MNENSGRANENELTAHQTCPSVELFLPDPEALDALAQQLAPEVRSGGQIHLIGDLGAGKTHFVRALLRSLGVTDRIKSPSYALLEAYKVSNLYCYHFDFYRFEDPREWREAGFGDIFSQAAALILVEWPQNAGPELPAPDLAIGLRILPEGRMVTLQAHTLRGQTWLKALQQQPLAGLSSLGLTGDA